jgi:hypothetical protein
MRIALVGCRHVGTWQVGALGDDRPWERDDRHLHEALRRRGAEVATPSWDDEGVDWSRYDVAVLRTTWDYHHHRARFLTWLDRVAASTTVWNPPEVVWWNTHKSYLRALDVPQPDTEWIGAADVDSLPARLARRPWRTAFLKPAVGATAEGTLRFRVDDDGVAAAVAHARQLLQSVDLVLLQGYLPSVETAGERSAIAFDGRVSHWVRKIPIPGDYKVQDDYGATDEVHVPTPAEEAFVARVLALRTGPLTRALPYARVDWLLGDDGAPLLVELELVEPCLFFRHGPAAADTFADVLLRGR